jgi:hypothetical protein
MSTLCKCSSYYKCLLGISTDDPSFKTQLQQTSTQKTKHKMKKNILTSALAILLGLIFFSGNAKAETIYYSNTANQSYQYGGLIYVASAQSVYATSLNYTVGYLGYDYNGNGAFFSNYSSHDSLMGGSYTNPAHVGAASIHLMEVSSSLLNNGSTVDASTALSNWSWVAPQVTGNEQFIGLVAYAGGQTYYGWAGFTFLNGVFTVQEAAFNSIPNSGITISGVPEPSSLSLLAIGLGGLAMLRRRRS